MSVIYKPCGMAREYSPYALNIYIGCSHRCKYCYAPHTLQKSCDSYFGKPEPRKDILKLLERDLQKNKYTEQVLLSFGGGSSWGKGYKDITHPNARDKGHREYKNEDNSIHYRYDPERGKNPAHYHVFNPHWTSNEDMYLDKDGNPAPRHSEDAALTKEEFEKLIQKILKEKSK